MSASRVERQWRAIAAEAKAQQRLYVESRMADVELRNEELHDDVAGLQQLLADTLVVDDFLDFETLKEAAPLPVFAPGPLANPEPPPSPDTSRPPEPTGLRARLRGARERPCLVTVRTTRDVFLDRDFARINAEACLLDLSAGLSRARQSSCRSGRC